MIDINRLADRHELLAARHPEFGRRRSDAGVVIVADSRFIGTFSGQIIWATLLNLTARLYKGIRHIRLVVPRDILRLPHIFFPNELESLREASIRFLEQLNQEAFTIEEGVPPSDGIEWTWVYVGAWDTRLPKGISVAGQGWLAFVNDESWQALAPEENPIGPMVAACLATAELYKALYPLRWRSSGMRIVFSAFDYSRESASNPRLPETIHVARTYVAGAGAVAMALLLLLNSTPAIRSGEGLHVIDDDQVDDTNLNRCVLAVLGDIGSLKAGVLEKRLDIERLALKVHPSTWQAFVETPGHNDPLRYERVVSCVDKYPGRRAVQYDRLPRVLLSAGTGDFLLTVSRHVLDDGLTCGLCYQAKETNPDCAKASQGAQSAFAVPVDPSISFVSALAGILLGAELLKELVPELQSGQIRNTARVQLLTSATKVFRRTKDPGCNCNSKYVAGGYQSTWGTAPSR